MSPSSKLCIAVVVALLVISPANARDDKAKVEAAIAGCTKICQHVLDACLQGSPPADLLFQQGKYCETLYYKNSNGTSKDCLLQQGCTEDEFNKIYDAACSGVALAVSCGVMLVGVVSSLVGIGR